MPYVWLPRVKVFVTLTTEGNPGSAALGPGTHELTVFLMNLTDPSANEWLAPPG